MIKLILMSRRNKALTHEEYVAHHLGPHAELFTSQPEVQDHVRRYTQSHPTEDRLGGRNMAPFDGVTEMWFDSMEGMKAVYESDNYKNNIVPDEERMMDRSAGMMLITKEDVIEIPGVPGLKRSGGI